MILTLGQVRELLEAVERSGRPAYVDWVNQTIRVLSESKPTMKADGTRLILSDGPAFHRDILFQLGTPRYVLEEKR